MTGEALIAAAGLMGLTGLPHCVAMCAAPCAAAAGRGAAAQPLFQIGRVAGYSAAGAVAAASVGALREGLGWSPVLRPLWTLLHLAALAVGLWMLWRGAWPAWLQRRAAAPAVPVSAGWQRIAMPVRSASAGALWIAWPCALSQSALLVAGLASTPGQGATAMALFAVASSPALWIGPALVQRWRAFSAGSPSDAFVGAAWPLRAAGALLVLGSVWALGHGTWMKVAAWCGLV
jgi:uncharacterized protein